jgi:hypothetical protein
MLMAKREEPDFSGFEELNIDGFELADAEKASPQPESSPIEPVELGEFRDTLAEAGAERPLAELEDLGLEPLGEAAGELTPAEETAAETAEQAPAEAVAETEAEPKAEEEAEAEEKAEGEEEEEKPQVAREPLLVRVGKFLAGVNPYTVMLGVALLALTIGTLCLLMEWWAYDFDTKAKTARQWFQ